MNELQRHNLGVLFILSKLCILSVIKRTNNLRRQKMIISKFIAVYECKVGDEAKVQLLYIIKSTLVVIFISLVYRRYSEFISVKCIILKYYENVFHKGSENINK